MQDKIELQWYTLFKDSMAKLRHKFKVEQMNTIYKAFKPFMDYGEKEEKRIYEALKGGK
mgnify:FL=1